MLKPHSLSVLPLQHAEGRRGVRRYFFLNFVNNLPFVSPKDEVMTLANTSRVRHRQRIHMAAGCSKETAEQWQQGTWRLIALKRLLFRQAQYGHKTRRVSRLSEETACWQPELAEEKEMSVCTRRLLCPEGKRPRASEQQSPSR